MAKVTRAGGPSVRVPPNVLAIVMEKHRAAESFGAISLWLNQAAVLLPDHDGTPRPGLWSKEAVAALIEQENQ